MTKTGGRPDSYPSISTRAQKAHAKVLQGVAVPVCLHSVNHHKKSRPWPGQPVWVLPTEPPGYTTGEFS